MYKMVRVRYGRPMTAARPHAAPAPAASAPGSAPAVIRGDAMRRANLGALLREVHQAPCTRSDLVERTGLTRAAVGSLLATLTEAGLVVERAGADPAPERRRPGRPSLVVDCDPRPAALACEITADALSLAVIGLGGRVLARSTVEHLTDGDVHPSGDASPSTSPTSPAAIAERLGREARELLAALPVDTVVLGVGVAVAGVVQRSSGRVVVAPNLGWEDVPLAEVVGAVLDRDLPVAVANEADLGLLAECRRGAAVGAADVVYVSAEAGVGGGVLVGGRPVHGAGGYAGELGHVPVRPDGEACRCGAHGCWETEIGEAALLRRAGRSPGAGRRGVAWLETRARVGDAAAAEAFAETGRWVGAGLAGLVNLLNPEVAVLGGYLASAFDLVGPAALAELSARALSVTRADVRVVPAHLGADAALVGAAELAFERVLADPLLVARA